MGLLTWTLQWRHNEHEGISNHWRHDCLLNCLFRHRSKKTSKLRVTGLCAGNSPVTGEFPAHRASNAEFFSIWWRHHEISRVTLTGMHSWNPSKLCSMESVWLAGSPYFTHLDLNKWNSHDSTDTLWNASSWVKITVVWWKFHCHLYLKFHLTKNQH